MSIVIPPEVANGVLHAPFFIFIKDVGDYSDQQLLELTGASDYQPLGVIDPSQVLSYRYICFLRDDAGWTHVIDDWWYSLWHQKCLRGNLVGASEKHTIFACSVGDCDESYGFQLYQAGQIVRDYEVQSPGYSDRIVSVDDGALLDGEEHVDKCKDDGLDIVLAIARSQGIDLNHEAKKIHTYVHPKPRPNLSLDGAIHNFF